MSLRPQITWRKEDSLDAHVTSGIPSESEIIREPWPGVSNGGLRTPEHLKVTYHIASAMGALPQVPRHSEELTQYRCSGFITGMVALPGWLLC